MLCHCTAPIGAPGGQRPTNGACLGRAGKGAPTAAEATPELGLEERPEPWEWTPYLDSEGEDMWFLLSPSLGPGCPRQPVGHNYLSRVQTHFPYDRFCTPLSTHPEVDIGGTRGNTIWSLRGGGFHPPISGRNWLPLTIHIASFRISQAGSCACSDVVTTLWIFRFKYPSNCRGQKSAKRITHPSYDGIDAGLDE